MALMKSSLMKLPCSSASHTNSVMLSTWLSCGNTRDFFMVLGLVTDVFWRGGIGMPSAEIIAMILLFSMAELTFSEVEGSYTSSTKPHSSASVAVSHGELWIFSDAAGVNRYNLRTGEIEYYQTPAEDMPAREVY